MDLVSNEGVVMRLTKIDDINTIYVDILKDRKVLISLSFSVEEFRKITKMFS